MKKFYYLILIAGCIQAQSMFPQLDKGLNLTAREMAMAGTVLGPGSDWSITDLNPALLSAFTAVSSGYQSLTEDGQLYTLRAQAAMGTWALAASMAHSTGTGIRQIRNYSYTDFEFFDSENYFSASARKRFNKHMFGVSTSWSIEAGFAESRHFTSFKLGSAHWVLPALSMHFVLSSQQDFFHKDWLKETSLLSEVSIGRKDYSHLNIGFSLAENTDRLIFGTEIPIVNQSIYLRGGLALPNLLQDLNSDSEWHTGFGLKLLSDNRLVIDYALGMSRYLPTVQQQINMGYYFE